VSSRSCARSPRTISTEENERMLKRDELRRPDSCLAKAGDDERIFVLLSRDPAAPATIRSWVVERLASGKNHLDDGQVAEALDCANRMARERLGLADAVESTRTSVSVTVTGMRAMSCRGCGRGLGEECTSSSRHLVVEVRCQCGSCAEGAYRRAPARFCYERVYDYFEKFRQAAWPLLQGRM